MRYLLTLVLSCLFCLPCSYAQDLAPETKAEVSPLRLLERALPDVRANPARARGVLEKADSLLAAATDSDPNLRAEVARNLALTFLFEGRSGIANDAINRAVALSDRYRNGFADSTLAMVYHDKALIAYAVNRRNTEGAALLLRAETYAKRSENPVVLLAVYKLLSGYQRIAGDDQGQLATLNKMLALAESAPELAYAIGDTYQYLADLHERRREYEPAITAGLRAVDAYTKHKPERVYLAQRVLANVYFAAGRLEEAEARYDSAFTHYYGELLQMKDGLNYVPVDSIKNYRTTTTLFASRARLFKKTDRLADALRDYEYIISVRERQRNETVSTSTRLQQSEILYEFYGFAIDLHYALLDGDESHAWGALLLSEKNKAYSLLGQLAHRGPGERVKTVRQKIAKLDRVNNPGADQELELGTLQLELNRLEKEGLDQLVDLTSYTVADIKDYFGDLPGDALEYFSGYDNSYRFHYRQDGSLRMTILDDPEQLNRRISEWRTTIQDGAYRAKSLLDPERQAAYDRTFQLLGDTLRKQLLPVDLTDRSVTIIPDGALQLLPFAALPLGVNEPFPGYGAIEYVGSDHEISFAYSVRHLNVLNDAPEEKPRDELVAFAPSFSGTASPLAVRKARAEDGQLPDLSPLSHNISEVKKVAELFSGSRLFTGPDARASGFLEEASEARILHLSTHGMVDSRDPNLSFLAFHPAEKRTRETDLLFYNDLASFNCKADLVVLSACETSLGALAPGENVLSMASAFASAGARSTLTSLWQVDDAATESLVVNFFTALQAGASRTAALHQAQVRQLNSKLYAHPYYWSAMILTGETEALVGNGSLAVLWWCLGIAVTLALVYALLSRYKSR